MNMEKNATNSSTEVYKNATLSGILSSRRNKRLFPRKCIEKLSKRVKIVQTILANSRHRSESNRDGNLLG